MPVVRLQPLYNSTVHAGQSKGTYTHSGRILFMPTGAALTRGPSGRWVSSIAHFICLRLLLILVLDVGAQSFFLFIIAPAHNHVLIHTITPTKSSPPYTK